MLAIISLLKFRLSLTKRSGNFKFASSPFWKCEGYNRNWHLRPPPCENGRHSTVLHILSFKKTPTCPFVLIFLFLENIWNLLLCSISEFHEWKITYSNHILWKPFYNAMKFYMAHKYKITIIIVSGPQINPRSI